MTKKRQNPPGTVATGIYWAPQTWQMARGAYVEDLVSDPACPGTFLGWLHRAIEAHAARGPAGRARLEIPPAQGREDNKGLNRHHPLRASTREVLEQAVVDDLLAGHLLSRSAFVHEAVTASIGQTANRIGRPPEPVPVKLPPRPGRRPSAGHL